MIKINIAKDFSETPDGRTPKDSDSSGEKFREEILIPRYQEAINKNDRLEICFDGCYGCPPSFLEESFGGAVRNHGVIGMLGILDLIANDDETIPGNVKKYVETAEKKHLKRN